MRSRRQAPAAYRARLLALLVLALLVSSLGATARADIHLSVLPATTVVAQGAVFDVELTIVQTGTAFNGYEAVVEYNPSLLTLVTEPDGDREGALMVGACGNRFNNFQVDAVAGRIEINHILLCAGADVTGPGVVYRLRFQAANTDAQTLVRLLPETRFFNGGLIVGPTVLVDGVVDVGAALPPAEFTFVPPTPTISCGGDLVVELFLDLLSWEMSGASISVGFDQTLIQPVAVTRGDLVSGASCVSFFSWTNQLPGESTVDVDLTLLGCTQVGSGGLIRIEFTSLPDTPGISPLTCADVRLRDPNNAEISFTCIEDQLTVSCITSGPPALAGENAVRVAPNPFNPRTTVNLELTQDSWTRVEIFDARGRRVRGLLEQRLSVGDHHLLWDGSDDQGRALVSGVYRVVVSTPQQQRSTAISLVR